MEAAVQLAWCAVEIQVNDCSTRGRGSCAHGALGYFLLARDPDARVVLRASQLESRSFVFQLILIIHLLLHIVIFMCWRRQVLRNVETRIESVADGRGLGPSGMLQVRHGV